MIPLERVLAAASATLLALSVTVVSSRTAPVPSPEIAQAAPAVLPERSPSPQPPIPSPSPSPSPSSSPSHAVASPAPTVPTTPTTAAPALASPAGDAEATSSAPRRSGGGSTSRPAPAPAPPPPPSDPARARFEERFPAQAVATQDVYEPATTRWALLIGINEHQGRTRDNLTERQDAETLHATLLANGWREDHIVLLTDEAATRENIEQGIAWLARKTNAQSAAIFSYGGHTKQWHGEDRDGDGEVTDEALWPSDNDQILDSHFVRMMADVQPGSLWINIGACEAAGFNDPGLAGPGRLLTFSSEEDEKSYEDPAVDNSVYMQYLADEALRGGHGDANGDGRVTVEEAFRYAQPRATSRTQGQRYGAQHPVMVDQLDGDFTLVLPPPPPRPRPRPEPSPSEPGCGLPICGRTGQHQA